MHFKQVLGAASLMTMAALLPSQLSATNAYDLAVLALNPVAYYTFSNLTGTTISDVTGNGHDGTISGGYTLGVAGPLAGATGATFNGSDAVVVVPGVWGGTPAITVIAWYQTVPGVTGPRAIVGGNGVEYVNLQTATASGSGSSGVFTDTGSVSPTLAPATTPTGWHMVVLSATSGAIDEYIDGVQVYSNAKTFNTVAPTLAANGVHIGGVGNTLRRFDGTISDVALFNTALSATDVSNLYTVAGPLITPEPASGALAAAALVGFLAFRRGR